MTATPTPRLFDDTILEPVLIHRLLYTEFNRFQADFEREALGEAQGYRSLCVLWWAAFAPELFPMALADEILALLKRCMESGKHSTFGWTQTIPLGAALACIYRDHRFIYEAVDNLSHETSSLLDQIAVELALAMPVVPCDMPELLASVRRNFEEWHFGSGDALVLYAASRGTKQEKMRQITEWCAELEPEAPDCDMLVRLRDRGAVANPLAGPMLRIQRYVILRLAGAAREELPLQLSGIVPGASTGLDRIVWSGDIWKRIEAHPLAGGWVEVNDVDIIHA